VVTSGNGGAPSGLAAIATDSYTATGNLCASTRGHARARTNILRTPQGGSGTIAADTKSAISSASGDAVVVSAALHCFNLAMAPHFGRG
jgi:hypothetical protein